MVGNTPNRVILTILVSAIIILAFLISMVYFLNGGGNASDPTKDSKVIENNEGSIVVSSYPLIAKASANAPSGNAPLKVNFTGSAIGGTSPYCFDWDFNQDGIIEATGKNASYIYSGSEIQTKLVTLSVTDAKGVKATDTVTMTIYPTDLSYPADLTIKIGGIYYLNLRNTTKGVSFPVTVSNKNPVDIEAVRVFISIYKWQSPTDSSVVEHREVYDDVISVPKAEKGLWGYYYATKTITLTINELDVGVYTVQAYVNPGASVPETDYSDNSAVKSFEINRRPVLPSIWTCRQW